MLHIKYVQFSFELLEYQIGKKLIKNEEIRWMKANFIQIKYSH